MLQDRVDSRLMRLLVEILLVVGVSETAVMFLLSMLAPNVNDAIVAVMDAGLLTFIAGPVLLWRFMRLERAVEQSSANTAAEPVLSGRSRWQSVAWGGAVFVIGCALTGSVLYFSRESERRLGQQKFDAQVERLVADVRAGLMQPVDGLNSIVGLYHTGAEIRQQMFERFFQTVNSAEVFPGVSSFGFVEAVKGPESLVIRHVLALGDDPLRLPRGYDMGQLAQARAAMRLAAQSGSPVLSATLPLTTGATPRAIYFSPAYGPERAGRPDAPMRVAGYAFASIDFARILGDVTRGETAMVHAQLLDGPAVQSGAVLFDSDAGADGGQFSRVLDFSAGGHAMTIHARSTEAFEAAQDSSRSMLLGVVLMLITLFATIATWLLVRGRDRVWVNSLAIAGTNARLVKAIQRSNSSVVITNAGNQIEWANAAFTTISGYSLEEALGKNLAVLRNVEISDPHAYGRIRSAIRSGQDLRIELCGLTPQGQSYWLDADIQMLWDAQGAYAGFIAVETDISERKQYERSLEDARSKAEAATLAKGQFLANMSHEIRTPMNAILGMLKLLGRTAMTPQQSDYAGKMEGAARTLLGVINAILDFSKVEAGKMALEIQPFAVDKLLHDLGAILSANLAGKPVAMVYDVDPALPNRLLGDSLRLEQVLVNLGGNALKFTESGQVVVSVRLLEVRDRVAHIGFAVRDSGIGIAPEHQSMIFEGFSQAETSTTRRFGGSGLGLAISKRLLALMGAQLHLHSVPGQGSTFSFELHLPLADDERAQSTPALPAPPVRPMQPLRGLRILVVDDNAINQQVAGELLRAEGAQVTLASDGSQAVTAVAAAAQPFDVVLMDLQMPVMDGMTAARHIRQQLGLTDLPIIAVTANVQSSDRTACLDAGMNEHVGKPFDLSELVAVVLRLTGRVAPDAHGHPASVGGGSADVLPRLWNDGELAAACKVVNLEAALARMAGLQSAYLLSAQAFLDMLPPVVGDLQTALQNDQPQAVMQMHTLKGVAATLGVTALSECAAQLEALCRQGAAPAAMHEATEALQQAVDEAIPALVQICAHLSPAAAMPTTSETTRWVATFSDLQRLLQAEDLQALEVYAQWRSTVDDVAALPLEALELALQDLDLKAALAACEVVLADLRGLS